jgi:sugar phosphate isomerase/epimerase
MALTLGLQVYSVRESLQKDFWGTMEAVAKIGYRNIELANHHAEADYGCGFGVPAAEFKRRMDGLGLKTVSSHVFPLENTDLDKVIEYAKVIGNDNIVCPMYFYTSAADALELAKRLNTWGAKLRKSGMRLFYHNHFHEFQKYGGKAVLDILLENTDPELVDFELDTFWALRGGVDPVAYLKKLGKRCLLIHQKDLTKGTKPENLFERVKPDAKIDMESFKKDGARHEDFTEAGEGMMDIRGIIAAANKIGTAKYIIIEQDYSSRGEIDSVALSYKNIQKLLSR